MRKACIWIFGGGIVLIILLGILGAIVGDESATDELATPPPSATPAPTATPPPQISAKALLAEREANATRFDATFKGKWVTVSGQIEKIDDGRVYLRGDAWGLSNVALGDLSEEKQIPLNAGEHFSATCKVGDYIIGNIFMNSCQ